MMTAAVERTAIAGAFDRATVRPSPSCCGGGLSNNVICCRHVLLRDVAVIMQAANTGLTGGSTPNGDDYDRPTAASCLRS